MVGVNKKGAPSKEPSTFVHSGYFVGSFMNSKSLLMTSAAALALTTNAWAAQGDAYVSLFGGYSSLGETDFIHYQLETERQDTDGVFRIRGGGILARTRVIFVSEEKLPVYSVGGAKTGSEYPDGYFTISRLVSAAVYTHNYLDYTRQFSSEFGSDGWVIGAALGIELMAGLRVEVEAAFRRFDMEPIGSLDVVSYERKQTRRDTIVHYRTPVTTGPRTSLRNTIATSGSPGFRYITTTEINPLGSFYASDKVVNFGAMSEVVDADGELGSFSFMANLWYDFPLGNTGIVPFIGTGVGIANLTIDYRFAQRRPLTITIKNYNHYTTTYSTTRTSGPSSTVITSTHTSQHRTLSSTETNTFTVETSLKDDQAVFAYQFGAGLGYRFSNGAMLSAQYRYFATGEADFGPVQMSVETQDIIVGITFPLGGRGR